MWGVDGNQLSNFLEDKFLSFYIHVLDVVDTKFKKGHVPWHKGRKLVYTSEQLKRMSEARKGKPAWNKGISPSKETIEKQRVSIKKITSNPEYRKQMSEKFKKAWTNSELREKQSKAIKRYFSNPEARKRLSEALKGNIPWNKGKKWLQVPWNKGRILGKNPEHSKIMQGKRLSQKTEFKKGLVPWNKGKHIWANKEHPRGMKGKLSPMKGKHPSEESIKKMSESHKKKMSNPDYRKKVIERNRGQILRLYESGSFPKQENTKPERQIKEELLKREYEEGKDFIHQYKFMNKFMCDFCFPQQKVIIEVYGDFWHANPNKYPVGSTLHKHQMKSIGRDKSKEAYIKKVDNNSWTYLVLWEGDIKKDVANCVNKIERVLKDKDQN